MSRTTTVSRAASELRIVLGQLVRRLRAENSFSISQGVVLSRLEREGPQTTSALALAERIRPQSMAHTVAELQAAGLVARRPHPLDRRQILIELTERGQERVSEDRGRREGWLARAISTQLSAEEQEILVQAVPLLRRLAQS
jgi:DNA-binding MarR family transcriptional regulator